jgi:hypothetical protein
MEQVWEWNWVQRISFDRLPASLECLEISLELAEGLSAQPWLIPAAPTQVPDGGQFLSSAGYFE